MYHLNADNYVIDRITSILGLNNCSFILMKGTMPDDEDSMPFDPMNFIEVYRNAVGENLVAVIAQSSAAESENFLGRGHRAEYQNSETYMSMYGPKMVNGAVYVAPAVVYLEEHAYATVYTPEAIANLPTDCSEMCAIRDAVRTLTKNFRAGTDLDQVLNMAQFRYTVNNHMRMYFEYDKEYTFSKVWWSNDNASTANQSIQSGWVEYWDEAGQQWVEIIAPSGSNYPSNPNVHEGEFTTNKIRLCGTLKSFYPSYWLDINFGAELAEMPAITKEQINWAMTLPWATNANGSAYLSNLNTRGEIPYRVMDAGGPGRDVGVSCNVDEVGPSTYVSVVYAGFEIGEV